MHFLDFRLGSDPEKLFPWSLMMEHLRKFGKFGLIMSILILAVITRDNGDSIDLNEFGNQVESGRPLFVTEESLPKYEKRLRDVIVDMERLEYI